MEEKKVFTYKRGSVWRCMTPLLIYLIVQNVMSFLVMLVYYMQSGIVSIEGLTADELMEKLLTMALENQEMLNFAILIFSYALMLPIYIWMYRKDTKRYILQGEENRVPAVPVVFYGFLILLGAASCISGSNMIYMTGINSSSESYTAAASALYSAGLIPEIIGIGLISPMAEEFLFRGLVYRRFKEISPSAISMVWASLIFALLHNNMVQGIYAFVMGMVLCYARERYGSMLAPVVIHIASNLMAVFATETGVLDFMYEDQSILFMITLAGCMIITCMIYLVERFVQPITGETILFKTGRKEE